MSNIIVKRYCSVHIYFRLILMQKRLKCKCCKKKNKDIYNLYVLPININ